MELQGLGFVQVGEDTDGEQEDETDGTEYHRLEIFE